MENTILILVVYFAWVISFIWQAKNYEERKMSVAEKVFGFITILMIILFGSLMISGKL
jgi:hypothetical protein